MKSVVAGQAPISLEWKDNSVKNNKISEKNTHDDGSTSTLKTKKICPAGGQAKYYKYTEQNNANITPQCLFLIY